MIDMRNLTAHAAKLRDVAKDAETYTHSAIWDYPAVLRNAADGLDEARQEIRALRLALFSLVAEQDAQPLLDQARAELNP